MNSLQMRTGDIPMERLIAISSRCPAIQKRNLAGGARRSKIGQCQATSSSVCLASAVAAQPDIKLEKMEPLGDRVLVKPAEASETTEGGILVASSAAANMGIADAVIGQVLAVGSEVEIKVSNGDTVVYSKYSTSDIPSPEGDVTFVAQKSILAILS